MSNRVLNTYEQQGQFKNKIINGDFEIWQRGTSTTSGNEYLADRWRYGKVGGTYQASQQSFALGQTDVPDNPELYSRVSCSLDVAAGNLTSLEQRIEDVKTFSGEEVTLTFYAKADASKNIATEFVQAFGSGGSPSAVVSGSGVTTHALTTSWQKFTVTTTIPSVSGKTLGTDNGDYLGIRFWFDAGTNFDSVTNSLGNQTGIFDISHVQLEKGNVATDFEKRHIGQELTMCQRYYEKSYNLDTVPGTGGSSAGYLRWSTVTSNNNSESSLRYNTIKRTGPTVTVYSVLTANTPNTISNLSAVADRPGVSGNQSDGGVTLNQNAGTGNTAGDSMGAHWTAEAEL
jgi:hypothetical protein